MKWSAATALVISLLVAGYAHAAPCVDLPHMSHPDAVITACTAEIQLSRARVDVATAYTVRSHAYALNGNKEQALADLNQALAIAPYFWGALVNRAVFYTNAGQLDLALKDYNDAILFHADIPEAYLYRAVIYSKKGDLDHALADVNEALRRNPKYIAAYLFRADRDLDMGRSDFAITDATSALSLDAKSAQALNIRCWVRAVSGQELKSALADCDRAVALAPREPGYLDSRGLVELRLGDWDGAIRDYTSAVRLSAMMPTSLYGRGVAERRKGDLSAAQADTSAATAMDKRVAAQFASWGLNP